jgi:hypothetical protein
VARIRVGFVKRLGKKRSRERAFIYMRSLSQLRELGGVCMIKGDIEPAVRIRHYARVHGSARYVHVLLRLPTDLSGHSRVGDGNMAEKLSCVKS